MTRAYTLEEIDDMRRSVGLIFDRGDTVYWTSDEQEMDRIRARNFARAANVEDKLRTYMMAGIEPEDLRKKADEPMEKRRRILAETPEENRNYTTRGVSAGRIDK